MRTRILSLFLCIAMLTAVCGCRTPADEPPLLPDSQMEEESAASKVPKPPKLVFWSQWDEQDAQAAVLREAVDEFIRTSPNAAGLTVEFNWAGDTLRNILGPAIEEGRQIDIFDCNTSQAYGDWRKFLLSLDEYYERSWPSTDGKAYSDVVFPALEGYSRELSGDGGVYTVGYQPYVTAILYNQSHFAAASIQQPPETWTEFTAACAALEANDFVPITVEDTSAAAWFGLHLARLKGPAFVTELVEDSTGMVWDDESVADAAGYLEKIVKEGYFSDNAETNAEPEGQREFASGEASMILGGSWMVDEIRRTGGANFPIGYFNYPALDAGVNDTMAGDFGSSAFVVNKDCQRPELAFELLAFLTTGKWDAEMAARTGGIPSDRANEVSPQLAEARNLFDSLETPFPPFGGVTANAVRYAALRENMQQMLGGSITAEKMIENSR